MADNLLDAGDTLDMRRRDLTDGTNELVGHYEH